MIDIILERLRQKHRTIPWPKKEPVLPERYRGRPIIANEGCLKSSCSRQCISCCPTDSLSESSGAAKIRMDLGRCLFCLECTQACPDRCISFSRDYRLSAHKREDLLMDGGVEAFEPAPGDRSIQKLLGRSLKLRQVSAGGCNACEADINVLNTPGYDLGRFGIQFVASPRHADGILVTGPVSKNMELALKKTWEAIASPKIAIAAGACAISGGPFRDHPEVCNGVDLIVPIDLYIPGCPPHPMTLLDGLLGLLGRLDSMY